MERVAIFVTDSGGTYETAQDLRESLEQRPAARGEIHCEVIDDSAMERIATDSKNWDVIIIVDSFLREPAMPLPHPMPKVPSIAEACENAIAWLMLIKEANPKQRVMITTTAIMPEFSQTYYDACFENGAEAIFEYVYDVNHIISQILNAQVIRIFYPTACK